MAYKNIDRRCLREVVKNEVEVLNAITRIDRSRLGNEKGRHQQQQQHLSYLRVVAIMWDKVHSIAFDAFSGQGHLPETLSTVYLYQLPKLQGSSPILYIPFI